MLFSTFTVLFTYVTFGLFQFASATPLLSTKDMMVKRDNADVLALLTTLRTNIASPLSEIKGLTASNTTTYETVAPRLLELTDLLNKAGVDITQLQTSGLGRRQTNDELANLIAGIINDIVDALQDLVGDLSTIPLLAGLLLGVDTALNQVLFGLGILLKGVLNLVAQLLVNVAALLRNLAFGLTLGTLGL